MQAIRYEWGERPDPGEVGAAVRESGTGIVFCQQSDTSTGVVSDVRALKEAVGDATLVVDAVSSLGAVPLETDAWGIDVVVSGSQKALMAPPGLAIVSVPEHVLAKREAVPELLLRLAANKKAQDDLDAAFTPAVSTIREPRRRARAAARAGSRGGVRSPRPPRPRNPRRREGDGARAVLARRRHGRGRDGRSRAGGIDSDELLRHLRDRHGVTLAPGQDQLKGKVFRIGHIGWFDVFDIATALAAVELSFIELGADIERGVAVASAFEAFERPSV